MTHGIILYSTDCPKCRALKRKLEEKDIPYKLCTNVDEMLELGLTEAPALSVFGRLKNFSEAIAWINTK